VKYRDPATGATWTGRGKRPRWLEVALEDGRKLEEFEQADLPLASAAQASTTRGAKAQRPAARGRELAPAKAKTSTQEAVQGIAAAMQGIEAAAPAAARPVDAEAAASAGAEGPDPGDADAPQSKSTGPVADAQAPAAAPAEAAWPFPRGGPQDSAPIVIDAALIVRAAELVKREQKATVRLIKTELQISTDRARAVLSKLETGGVVGACDERGSRKVLVAA
jgi:ribosomal protein S25